MKVRKKVGRKHNSYKTELMRVPVPFREKVNTLTKKRGYKSQSEFLHNEGLPLFENAEYLSDTLTKINIFRRTK